MTFATLTVRVIHSNLVQLLGKYSDAGIMLHSVEITDELTALLSVDRKHVRLFRDISEIEQAQIRVLHLEGLFWKLRSCLHRPVLIFGVFLLLVLSATVSRTIFFVNVEGNLQIPDKQILDAAQQVGIRFGAPRKKIRSEQVKNRLMDMLPQLQWVGITTEGCVATVFVRERHDDPQMKKAPLCGIVAARDGIIQSIQVTKGNALLGPGQAVKAGELLVSAYTDCGVNLRATGAEGEIYAFTVRELQTVLPVAHLLQGEKTAEIQRCSLIIGKKRINFYKDSGICDTRCDKMYKEYYVTLPGGFRLPLAIAIERVSFRKSQEAVLEQSALEELLGKWGKDYLHQEMVAGQILSGQTYMQQKESHCAMVGIYRCLEMIGRLQQEEIAGNYGKTG